MVMYECQFFDQMKTPGTDIYNFFQANKLSIKSKKPKIMQPRLSLKGGNVTLFRVLARANKEYEICYLDINSHYPSIGIRHDFVCGKAAHLLGPNMTSRLTYDALKWSFVYHDPVDGTTSLCDGIVQCTISIPFENHKLNAFPFLPVHYKFKKNQPELYRASCFQCLKEKCKRLCDHDMEAKKFTGVWTLSEIAYNIEIGYIQHEIQESLVFKELKPLFAEYLKIVG